MAHNVGSFKKLLSTSNAINFHAMQTFVICLIQDTTFECQRFNNRNEIQSLNYSSLIPIFKNFKKFFSLYRNEQFHHVFYLVKQSWVGVKVVSKGEFHLSHDSSNFLYSLQEVFKVIQTSFMMRVCVVIFLWTFELLYVYAGP